MCTTSRQTLMPLSRRRLRAAVTNFTGKSKLRGERKRAKETRLLSIKPRARFHRRHALLNHLKSVSFHNLQSQHPSKMICRCLVKIKWKYLQIKNKRQRKRQRKLSIKAMHKTLRKWMNRKRTRSLMTLTLHLARTIMSQSLKSRKKSSLLLQNYPKKRQLLPKSKLNLKSL